MPYFGYMLKLLSLIPSEKVGGKMEDICIYHKMIGESLQHTGKRLKEATVITQSASTGRCQFLILIRDLAFGPW